MFLPSIGTSEYLVCTRCEARAINNKRQIVGRDRVPGGQYHAVLWKVTFTYFVPTDLQPGAGINALSLGAAALVPTALLSSETVDARELDPAHFTLGDERGDDTPVARGRDGRPVSELRDVNGDGRPDLVLYFDQPALERNRDLTRETAELVLVGDLGDGTVLRGADKVVVR